jgi:hypothetical protein
MHLEKEIFRIAYGGLSFIKERNQGCIVLLAIGYQPKEKALVRVINYPARGIEIQQSKNLRLLPITTSVPFEVMQNIDKIDLKLNWNQTKIARFCNDDSKFSGY